MKKLCAVLLLVAAACDASVGPGGAESTAWPHEPTGFVTLTDEPFDSLDKNGWHSAQRQTTNGSGLSLTIDDRAPLSPSSVLAFKYAAGFAGGSEPGIEFFAPPAPVRETYFAFWWMPSDPWENHASDVNTIADLFAETTGIIFIQIDGSTNTVGVVPEFDGDTRILTPNVHATPLVLGKWHKIEWYVKYSSSGTSRDGVTRWWLDGALQGEYADLQMPDDAGFVEYAFSPTWGGTGGAKTQTDWFWIDHVHISTP